MNDFLDQMDAADAARGTSAAARSAQFRLAPMLAIPALTAPSDASAGAPRKGQR
jgi:hypothetical protein